MKNNLKHNYKVGDWIILSEEGIDRILLQGRYKRKEINEIPKKIFGIIEDEEADNDLMVTGGEVSSDLFRMATSTEKKKEQIRTMFIKSKLSPN
jgi:hypothetical protein